MGPWKFLVWREYPVVRGRLSTPTEFHTEPQEFFGRRKGIGKAATQTRPSLETTLRETNIAPENWRLEDEIPFGKPYFQLLCYLC